MVPVPAVYVPEQPVPQLPPPEKASVPAFAFTAPVLLNAAPIVLLIPPVIWNVPALLNVLVPTLLMIPLALDRRSTRLNSSHTLISYPFFCFKKNTDALV